MERQPQHPRGGEHQPEVNSYGTDDPAEQAQIEQAREEATRQRRRDREEWERYVAAGANEEDAESLVEFKHDVQEQREQAARQLAEQHAEDSPAERDIRLGLYLARSEGRIIDDATARAVAGELHGDEGSALDGLASSGAIQRDRLLQELAGYPVEGSWRVHWIDALTQYAFDRGERGPVPQWAEVTVDEPATERSGERHQTTASARVEPAGSSWDTDEQVGDVYEVQIGRQGIERAERLQPAPRIYVACLASYNQGIQHGLWIDANQEPDDLRADIEAMLVSSPISGAEEYAIHDHDGFAGFELGEHEDLDLVSRVARGIAEHGEAFAAYLSWAGSSEEACRDFRQHYVGTYPDVEAWAREVGQDFEWEQQLDERLDPDLARYVVIDYRALARDMASDWHFVEGTQGVHVFTP